MFFSVVEDRIEAINPPHWNSHTAFAAPHAEFTPHVEAVIELTSCRLTTDANNSVCVGVYGPPKVRIILPPQRPLYAPTRQRNCPLALDLYEDRNELGFSACDESLQITETTGTVEASSRS